MSAVARKTRGGVDAEGDSVERMRVDEGRDKRACECRLSCLALKVGRAALVPWCKGCIGMGGSSL